MKNVVLGIFDSGIGGLTVAREIERRIPGVSYVYFGDTARLPYGTKTASTVVNYAIQNSKFLKAKGATMPIIACNTASAAILKTKGANKKISLIFKNSKTFNVIEPAVEAAKEATKNKKIGVLATPTTVNSRIYERLLPGYKVVSVPAPLLVPLIEAGWEYRPETKSILREYVNPLKKAGVDTVILGCTHYPFIAKLVRDMMGDKVKIINPAVQTAEKIELFVRQQKAKPQGVLTTRNYLNKLNKYPHRRFYVSDLPKGFSKQAARFMGHPIKARLI
ncbi:MAG: glutamate racemase [Candidatus Terrybacteria bacterium RIFCSPLOWO2_01_FULL_44_24]|uniref:Glutamate racemase n=1 Tax=Candidatus Terrybacteria bacterium RIFCSPHIGHO2_01_FULL_43_35 TaxID=1802361 RepID=A0A1G2PC23_9BACT|nr:MAG: glutamate racemase [Candidatus Terrybacteria bacterium RIFCSPHIGHO2_01_FULL_43_35]OHA49673.1 MAG: glutamate racemase [Candidatus Terrybacteria bacterium RIFCSPHIGHO2_02_FULL_43_14]OHA51338.1 MAG: glutamate racemase [Candidatus Terrybacteria bacterium RIFCSPLOWO2_01_FULL_44_24]